MSQLSKFRSLHADESKPVSVSHHQVFIFDIKTCWYTEPHLLNIESDMAGVAWVKFREMERDLLGGVMVLAANRDGRKC